MNGEWGFLLICAGSAGGKHLWHVEWNMASTHFKRTPALRPGTKCRDGKLEPGKEIRKVGWVGEFTTVRILSLIPHLSQKG